MGSAPRYGHFFYQQYELAPLHKGVGIQNCLYYSWWMQYIVPADEYYI